MDKDVEYTVVTAIAEGLSNMSGEMDEHITNLENNVKISINKIKELL